MCCVSFHLAELPRITSQSQEIKDAIPGKFVNLMVQATGTKPLATGDKASNPAKFRVGKDPKINVFTPTSSHAWFVSEPLRIHYSNLVYVSNPHFPFLHACS